jgi:hypothetical protein
VLTASVRCTADAPCIGTAQFGVEVPGGPASARAAATIPLGQATLNVPSGAARRVRVRISPAARRALRRLVLRSARERSSAPVARIPVRATARSGGASASVDETLRAPLAYASARFAPPRSLTVKRANRRDSVIARVRCRARAVPACAGTLRLRAGRRLVGVSTFRVRPGTTRSVTVPVASWAARRTTGGRALTVAATTTTRQATGDRPITDRRALVLRGLRAPFVGAAAWLGVRW